MIVPALDDSHVVIGIIDVESEKRKAFGEEDLRFVERCAAALLPLFQQLRDLHL
jgi:putative methionine-R-sulfoxide reductase with GAF domain